MHRSQSRKRVPLAPKYTVRETLSSLNKKRNKIGESSVDRVSKKKSNKLIKGVNKSVPRPRTPINQRNSSKKSSINIKIHKKSNVVGNCLKNVVGQPKTPTPLKFIDRKRESRVSNSDLSGISDDPTKYEILTMKNKSAYQSSDF